jgi:hypothetical protein
LKQNNNLSKQRTKGQDQDGFVIKFYQIYNEGIIPGSSSHCFQKIQIEMLPKLAKPLRGLQKRGAFYLDIEIISSCKCDNNDDSSFLLP